MQQPLDRFALLLLISGFLLGGCSTSKEKLLPQDGPTMLDIYEGHLDRVGQGQIEPTRAQTAECDDAKNCEPAAGETPDLLQTRAELTARTADRQYFELVGYTREVHNEIEVLFPTLPNPMMVMYVFPHLAGEEKMPVPGYATSFSMYSKTEFALPGEVSQQALDQMLAPQPASPLEASLTQTQKVPQPLISNR